jgi:hypothetical protein
MNTENKILSITVIKIPTPTIDIVEPPINIVEPPINIVEPPINIVEPPINIVEPPIDILIEEKCFSDNHFNTIILAKHINSINYN